MVNRRADIHTHTNTHTDTHTHTHTETHTVLLEWRFLCSATIRSGETSGCLLHSVRARPRSTSVFRKAMNVISEDRRERTNDNGKNFKN